MGATYWRNVLKFPTQSISPANLFLDWFLIGLQSFGGGSSTFSLVHQVSTSRGWLSEAEFVRDWALVQISPGINLIKLTVMIGYKQAGWRGVLAAVSGLLLPSALLTVLMTSGYATIRSIPWIQAIMKGVLPAAIGLSFAMCVQMAQSIFITAYQEGAWRLAAHILILTLSILLMGINGLSPVLIIFLSGGLAVALFALIPVRNIAKAQG